MNITVGEQYKLTSDPMNVIINEKYEKKNKQQEVVGHDYKAIGYYPNVTKALVALLHKDLRESEATSVEELLEAIENAVERILNREGEL
ncbi:hypothetical protein TROLL_43 [Bacillus phage Troll]|uniref:DUF5405 domain-containing protein n=6 Tax=Caudoviricetes TaxID=2731619 RepID=A0A7U3TSZ6_9CAUD|nr:replication initiation protein [Bacillus phage Troll]YP_009055803.1 replication initiation protein [Bacillus phage Riley]YP_009289919.1 replication initiation protein [Bacillus phage Phrodo]AMW61526.1 hypothetical protein JUGLONE_39 [Bacillus phage Juglone]ASZ75772.1 hypothetical protein TAFFO16_39 [Bacillus phage Taffo16]QPY77275.1 hypothetical protein ANTHOS_38 [Bacillus phage Anthos]ULF48660.1 hypothetical protein [Bacillus phage BillyBob]AGT13568.1 hypothetical protein TROLL_43 [Bacil